MHVQVYIHLGIDDVEICLFCLRCFMVYISIIVVLCPPLSFQTVTTLSTRHSTACLPCVWCPMSQSGEKTSPQELFHLCEGFCKDHASLKHRGNGPGKAMHMDGSDIIGIVSIGSLCW